MIKVHITTMNPKFTIELETDDSDFEKFKKMLEYITDKFQVKENPLYIDQSNTHIAGIEDGSLSISENPIKRTDNLHLPPISFTTSDEKLNTHMDL